MKSSQEPLTIQACQDARLEPVSWDVWLVRGHRGGVFAVVARNYSGFSWSRTKRR